LQELSIDQTREKWKILWEEAEQEILKIGARQDYSEGKDGKKPSYLAWMAKDEVGSRALMDAEGQDPDGYAAMCRQKHAAGVDVCRIDYVEQPLTPYMAWAQEYLHRVCAPAHERHLQVGERQVEGLIFPKDDVVIFGNQSILAYRYEGLGRLVGADFYDAATDNINPFLALKAALLQVAMPLDGSHPKSSLGRGEKIWNWFLEC